MVNQLTLTNQEHLVIYYYRPMILKYRKGINYSFVVIRKVCG